MTTNDRHRPIRIGLLGDADRLCQEPFKDASNERVKSEFWKTSEMFRMPYTRGQIVALMIDAQLRKASGGSRSLDVLVRGLLDDVRTSGEGVSTQSVLRKVGALTSQAFECEIRDIVLAGRNATIPPDAFAPCLNLKESTREEGEGSARRTFSVPQFEYAPAGQSACPAVL